MDHCSDNFLVTAIVDYGSTKRIFITETIDAVETWNVFEPGDNLGKPKLVLVHSHGDRIEISDIKRCSGSIIIHLAKSNSNEEL